MRRIPAVVLVLAGLVFPSPCGARAEVSPGRPVSADEKKQALAELATLLHSRYERVGV